MNVSATFRKLDYINGRSVYGYEEDTGSLSTTIVIFPAKNDNDGNTGGNTDNKTSDDIASSDMAAGQIMPLSLLRALSEDGYSAPLLSQGSINVSSSGSYAFPLTVPAALRGTNTAIKVYLADRGAVSNGAFNSSALPAGTTEARIFTESGGTVTTLPENIIAAANLQADTAKTFSIHIAQPKASSNNTGNNTGGNNTNNNNTGNDTNNNTGNTTNDVQGVGGSSGGGGCSSVPVTFAVILTALIPLTKSRR